jgi:hypothetical protein
MIENRIVQYLMATGVILALAGTLTLLASVHWSIRWDGVALIVWAAITVTVASLLTAQEKPDEH